MDHHSYMSRHLVASQFFLVTHLMACFYAARIKDTGYVDTLCNNIPQTCLGTLIDDFIESHIGITLSVGGTSNCMENSSMQD